MARAALPDLPLTFCVTLTILATLRALDLSRTSSASTWWAVSGLGAGLGFLMKGPVALAIPAVVLLPIAWREWRTVRIEPRGIAVAGVVFAIIGLPWYVVMWFTHGEAYLQSFFVGDNLERFTTERFNDARPLWFYVPVLLGGMMPWSVYLVAVTGAGITGLLKRTLRLDRGQWRLLLWAVMPLLFYTVSIGKQPRYILPVLPPLAALLARSLASRIQQGAAGRTSLLSASTWITAAMYGAFAFLFIRMGPLLVSAYPAARWIAPLLALCGAVGFAWIAAAGAWRRLPAVGAIAATLLLLAVQFGALAGRRPEAVEEMAMLVRAQRTGNETIGVYGAFARNLGFYTGTARTEIFGPDQARDFLGSPERVLLILRSDDVKAVEAVTGTPVHVLGRVEYWNTANVRLRTLLRPDPAEEIETIALISNR
jgi:4-amino-4-deoxy-L-arabinose transferase-like glycosyltransferase